MRQISCDGCGKVAEHSSGHDITRCSFEFPGEVLIGDLCGMCRGPIVKAFPSGRVELTIPEWMEQEHPDQPDAALLAGPPLDDVWDGRDRANTVIP